MLGLNIAQTEDKIRQLSWNLPRPEGARPPYGLTELVGKVISCIQVCDAWQQRVSEVLSSRTS